MRFISFLCLIDRRSKFRNEHVLDDCPADQKTKDLILEDVRRRFASPIIKCRASKFFTSVFSSPIDLSLVVGVRCYEPAGIDAVKDALRAGLTASTPELPLAVRRKRTFFSDRNRFRFCLQITLKASPFYDMNVTCAQSQAGLTLLDEALQRIKTTIEQHRGYFEKKMPPTVLSDADAEKIPVRQRKTFSIGLKYFSISTIRKCWEVPTTRRPKSLVTSRRTARTKLKAKKSWTTKSRELFCSYLLKNKEF